MSSERWLGPKQIAEQYSVSRDTARRWIMRLMGDEVSKKEGRGKRPYRIRRIPQSLLERNLDELMNG
jgi:DNA-binding GntR family transcriptional regulator